MDNVARVAMAPMPSGRSRGLALASIAVLFLATSSAVASSSSVTSARFLRPHVEAVRKTQSLRKTALLKEAHTSPGYFRSAGVRGGVEEESMGALGDSGRLQDSSLNRNILTGDSMAYDFRILDNLEPVAPMDRLHAALGTDSESGHYMNPVYVPPYLNSEAFPNVHGKGCNCSMADKATGKNIECTCGEKGAEDHYTWLKDTPVFGTDNFTLTPADITYNSGNYWGPATRDGLVAPADALPPHKYPNQANGDHIWPLPATAKKDRIGVKFTRYIDQVQDRSEQCDTVSKKCTVACKPGDEVVATIGNTIFNGKIVKAFVGNAVQVEFAPDAAKTAKSTSDCPLEAMCSAFRYCKSSDIPHCQPLRDKDVLNWAGMHIRKHECPPGAKVCKTVSQVVMATFLKKGEKTCRAAAR